MWAEGMAARIVEIDTATMLPSENGTVFNAVITKVGKTFVRAKTQEIEFARPTTFYPETGWTSMWGNGLAWRLMPAEDAGQVAP